MQVSKIVVDGTIKARSERVYVFVEALSGGGMLLRMGENYSFEEIENGEHLKLVDEVLTKATVMANVATAIARKAEAQVLEHLRGKTDAEVKVKFEEVVG